MTTLIGTNPDQVPVNSMLGGMAYQDPDSVSVKDFNSSGTANINSLVSPAASVTNLSYSGTLTGGTGVINIGSSQIYKDATGNVGIGNSPVSNGKTLTLVNASTGNSSFYLQNSTTGFTATDGTLLQLSGSAAYLWNFENSTLSLGTNNTEYVRLTGTGDVVNLGTGATKLQEGTTAQRPSSPQEGMIRKNSTLGVIEGYSEGAYVSLEAGRLINIFESMTSGVDSTFNVSPKTSYIIVEMIAGGGGGGGFAGSLSNNTVGLGRSGTPGCAVRFIIKPSDLVSTYYYRIGAGGASSATGTGTDGGDTIFSKESTSGTMTNYLQCGGGIGGTVGAIYTPPVHLQYSSWPGLTIQGTASAWVKLETTEGYTGENILAVSSDYAAFRSRDQLATFNQITSRMNCFYYTGIGYRGVGGGGRESKQTSGGVLTSILNAAAGLGGMIRIYEYS